MYINFPFRDQRSAGCDQNEITQIKNIVIVIIDSNENLACIELFGQKHLLGMFLVS